MQEMAFQRLDSRTQNFQNFNNMARGLPETWTGFYLRPLVKMLNVLLSIYSQSN